MELKYVDYLGEEITISDEDDKGFEESLLGNPEKERRRKRREKNAYHKARGVRRISESGEGYEGSSRLKVSANGDVYVQERQTKKERKLAKQQSKKRLRNSAYDADEE